MKIRNRIILNFFLVTAFSSLLIFYFAVNISQNSLKKIIGANAVQIAQQTIDSVDRIIYRRWERWGSYINSHTELISLLEQSNRDYSSLSDTLAYIEERDKEWQAVPADQLSPDMKEVINNRYADNFRGITTFYENQYGYQLFPEVFLTNKYGVVIVATGRTSDLNQADEDWWLKTKQEKYYFSDVEVDESTGTQSISLSFRVDDQLGNFQGVLKVVFSIREIRELISAVAEANIDAANLRDELKLIDKNGKVIFTIGPDESENLSNISDGLLDKIKSSKEKYFVAEGDDQNEPETLYAIGFSHGYKNYNSQGWIFLVEDRVSNIYAPVRELSNTILLIIFLSIIFSFFMAWFLSNLIAKPIEKLRLSITGIEVGNMDSRVGTNANDEVGVLSRTFDKMILAVKKSRAEVEKKVLEQTKEIASKAQDLEKQKVAILNILEDVEKEKQKSENLARDLEKFKLAVDNASDHIIITDTGGLVLYANKAVESITGFSVSEVIGKKAGSKDLWGGLMEAEFYKKFWDTIKNKKKVFTGLVKNKRKNGQIYEALASVAPILDKDGEVNFFVGIERDVTKEKEIDRAKSEFVSLASHQLRTPLSAINWYAEMLLNGDAGKLKSEQQDYVKEIFDGNQRMIDLVNALLNVSRIELGTLAVDSVPTDLRELAKSVLDELKPQILQKKQKVLTDFDKNLPLINLDAKIMRIVWQNFLSNAVKYTPEKGKINVSINVKGKEALISVADTGYGIPQSQQSKIFTKLFRADNIREKVTDGTGLGLYIVKSVIEQFGGKVWFDSVENKGTTFYATIPLKGVAKKEGSKGLNYNK